MCSGLNNQCIESTHVLDIVVSFKKDFLKYTFALPVRIAEDSEVDLIIGLKTIKDLNLVKILPEFFQNVDQIGTELLPHPTSKQLQNSRTDVLTTIPVQLLYAEPEHVVTYTDTTQQNKNTHNIPLVITSQEGIKPSDADSRWQDDLVARGACTSKTCTASCGCPTSLAAAAAQLVLDEFTVHPTVEAAVLLSPPRQSDLGLTTDRSPEVALPTPSSKAPAHTRGLIAALLREREELPEVQPFEPEEIDYESKDIVAPFQDNPTQDKTYLIDLIQIDGTPEQIARIKAICVKHIKLFNNKLGPEPPRIPPFGLPLRDPG